MRSFSSTALWSLLLAALLLTLPACDSDDDNGNRDDISGLYTISEITLDPDGSLIDPINVLDRASNLEIQFLPEDGEFLMTYDFRNDDDETLTRAIQGSYDVSGGEVEIDFDSEDSDKRRQLLLPDEFDLDRNGSSQLSAEINVEDVNLGRYSMEDFGNQEIDEGVLQVTINEGIN